MSLGQHQLALVIMPTTSTPTSFRQLCAANLRRQGLTPLFVWPATLPASEAVASEEAEGEERIHHLPDSGAECLTYLERKFGKLSSPLLILSEAFFLSADLERFLWQARQQLGLQREGLGLGLTLVARQGLVQAPEGEATLWLDGLALGALEGEDGKGAKFAAAERVASPGPWRDGYQAAGVAALHPSSLGRWWPMLRQEQGLTTMLTAAQGQDETPGSRPFFGIPLAGCRLSQAAWGGADFCQWAKRPLRPCLFLDRDGVVIEDRHYAYKPNDLVLLPGVLGLIAWARSQDWRVVVVSNQAGVAKAYFSMAQLAEATKHIEGLLAEYGAVIDAWYYAPSHPGARDASWRGESHYRKPGAGMLLQAAHEQRVNLAASWMVGDKDSDVIKLAGVRSLLLQGRYPLANSDVPRFADHKALLAYLQGVLSLG